MGPLAVVGRPPRRSSVQYALPASSSLTKTAKVWVSDCVGRRPASKPMNPRTGSRHERGSCSIRLGAAKEDRRSSEVLYRYSYPPTEPKRRGDVFKPVLHVSHCPRAHIGDQLGQSPIASPYRAVQSTNQPRPVITYRSALLVSFRSARSIRRCLRRILHG